MTARAFDAIIVGAGQAGPPLAGRLTAAGMKVALIERHLVGGTCVNTGCMPTKTLVASAYAAHLARRAGDYGVTIEGPIGFDIAKARGRATKVTEDSRGKLTDRLETMAGLAFIRGQARFEGPDRIRVGEDLLTAPRIFLNVGGRAFVPDFPGVDHVPFLNNSTLLALEELPEHLLIVGGSYIGLEFAQIYARFGSKVTVVERAPRLIGREDEEVSDAIRAFLEAEGIAIRTGAECIRLMEKDGRPAIGLDCREGPPEVAGSHILLAVGRVPNTGDLGLEAAGVEADARGYIQVDDARHQRAGHLGDGRLQRPRRLHPHRL